MKPIEFSFDWVDLVILAVLIIGVLRGRKRGMSEEFLDMLKWVAIVLVAASVYEPGGLFLAQNSIFSLLACYLAVYALAVIGIAAVFSAIRHQVGTKLVSSDVFGQAEYYLGMVAGAFRYACIVLVIMAFLHARYYTPQEVMAQEKFQKDNFGDIYFPTLMDMQREVFDHSFAGRMVRDYLPVTLIKATAPEDKGLGGDNAVFRQHDRRVNEVLDKR